jgi:hypothetical protein
MGKSAPARDVGPATDGSPAKRVRAAFEKGLPGTQRPTNSRASKRRSNVDESSFITTPGSLVFSPAASSLARWLEWSSPVPRRFRPKAPLPQYVEDDVESEDDEEDKDGEDDGSTLGSPSLAKVPRSRLTETGEAQKAPFTPKSLSKRPEAEPLFPLAASSSARRPESMSPLTRWFRSQFPGSLQYLEVVESEDDEGDSSDDDDEILFRPPKSGEAAENRTPYHQARRSQWDCLHVQKYRPATRSPTRILSSHVRFGSTLGTPSSSAISRT